MVTETCTLQGEKNPFGAFWPLAEAGGKAFRLYNKNPTQGSGPRATERSHPDPLLSVSFCGATSCVEVHMCVLVYNLCGGLRTSNLFLLRQSSSTGLDLPENAIGLLTRSSLVLIVHYPSGVLR